MKCLIVTGFVGLVFAVAGCGSGDGVTTQQAVAPTVNATGTWTGVTSSVNKISYSVPVPPPPATPPTSLMISLSQSGASLSGHYSATNGILGDIAGTISGNTTNMTITLTSQSCSGSLTGTGVISTVANGPSTMDFHATGFSTCSGNVNYTANLTQISVPPITVPLP